ncbi:TetR/AcrR family transcriptional regulator [Lentisphaera profundi]|uniref:TetR/AcrR family transcriptional regulator n=1 Tax=Lentisphaera profundi TaxID=1658616 RepID=A0ABY7VPZ1_9BACT|nr:TetR/AcrR family transcriptional regulator [Lentisphaera profundi]WDE95782.1 TetR/AcrR family transcriptional regulator [Lentisphaera profundi]
MKTKKPSKAREKLIVTAERLFYAEGIRTVGIDRVTAEAKVAKMTLYNHFASKDELILEVLKYRDGLINNYFNTQIEQFITEGLSPLAAFFTSLKNWFEGEGFRGCAFLNASAELADRDHPGFAFAVEHKKVFKKLIHEVVIKTKGPEGAAFVPAIFLMVEGAIVTAVLEGNSTSADEAMDASMKLLATI